MVAQDISRLDGIISVESITIMMTNIWQKSLSDTTDQLILQKAIGMAFFRERHLDGEYLENRFSKVKRYQN